MLDDEFGVKSDDDVVIFYFGRTNTTHIVISNGMC